MPILHYNLLSVLNIFDEYFLQKRWTLKEQKVRDEMNKAKLAPGASEFGAIQGEYMSVHIFSKAINFVID